MTTYIEERILSADLRAKISGARPQGNTSDDTAELMAAIAANAGGIVDLVPGHTYTMTSGYHDLPPEGITINGHGATIHINLGAVAGNVFRSIGSEGAPLSLVNSVSSRDIHCVLSSGNAGTLSVGDTVMISDQRNDNYSYVARIFDVRSVDAVGGGIGFPEAIGCSYSTSNAAFLKKLSMRGAVVFRDIHFTFNNNSFPRGIFYGAYVDGVLFEDCFIDNHDPRPDPTNEYFTIDTRWCRNVIIRRNRITIDNPETAEGSAFLSFRCEKVRFEDNECNGFAIGCSINGSFSPMARGNKVTFPVQSSLSGRGIKVNMCRSSVVTSNKLVGMDVGVKVQDTAGGDVISNNTLVACGAVTPGSNIINFSNQHTPAAPDGQDIVISGNTMVENVAGAVVYLPSPIDRVVVTGNVIRGGTVGIAAGGGKVLIANNIVQNVSTPISAGSATVVNNITT